MKRPSDKECDELNKQLIGELNAIHVPHVGVKGVKGLGGLVTSFVYPYSNKRTVSVAHVLIDEFENGFRVSVDLHFLRNVVSHHHNCTYMTLLEYGISSMVDAVLMKYVYSLDKNLVVMPKESYRKYLLQSDLNDDAIVASFKKVKQD